MPRRLVSLGLLGLLGLAACFGAGKGGGEPAPWTSPTLEITVSGIHLGPAATDPGSGASLSDQHDPSTGRVTDSQLHITATSTAAGGSCQLAFDRFGDGISPIAAGAFQLDSSGLGGSGNGTVAPIAGERVVGPADSWSCTGSSCDGMVLALSALDSTHASGYLAG